MTSGRDWIIKEVRQANKPLVKSRIMIMRTYTINIMHNPPTYLVEMGLDAPHSFTLITKAANKKQAEKHFTALGYPCDTDWIKESK